MATELRYPVRSEFFEPVEAAIGAAGGTVNARITVALKSGGYERDARVLIKPQEERYFVTDWESQHPSRFSARCRAAAAVLRRTGHSGWFRLRHSDGELIIEPG